MIADHELVEAEGSARDGGVDGAMAGAGSHVERIAPATGLHLVFLTAAEEAVVGRIDREQNLEMALGVGLENDEVAVVLGPHVNRGAIAP